MLACDAKSEGAEPSIHPNILHWLAGLLEGEGSFVCGPPSKKTRTSIQITMTDKDVIARVAQLWGSSIYPQKKRAKHYKQAYVTRISGKRAVEWMHILYPLMGARRQIAITKAIAAFNKNVSGHYKLREGQIQEIKDLIAAKTLTHAQIASIYNVERSTITYVGLGRIKVSRLPKVNIGSIV